ncbi:addiction module protein [Aliarcobacter skirrowii]|uniref:addiction module protein n=1 Tax=Aliarcobacter skirrowii TaxID=28200 RepID=UPI0029BB37DE|nr:addiction module protein [Aliarcobacter skirrowii]MDX4037607.1 addiction module protein [Aliarcobacter skirrowii]
MSFTLNIENMNIQDKFLAMEQIWSSLKDENIKELTPDWHLDILEDRENKRNFIDIEEAKKALKSLLK